MGQLADSLKKYFAETSQDVLDREWEGLKHLNKIGPDVLAYAERVKTFYGPLMRQESTIPDYPSEDFMPDVVFYLVA